MSEKKRLLITHVADPDGITPIILAQLVFDNFDKLLLNPPEVDANLRENLDKYDEIHLVDLSMSETLAAEIASNEQLKGKIKLFDHHKSALPLNKYSFATVIDEQNGQKESATSIYYSYLKTISDNKTLHKASTQGLVDQVRIIDTYDFKTENDKTAHNIDDLFSIMGRQNYIDYFFKYLKTHDEFQYSEAELFLIKLEQDKKNNYIEQREGEMLRANLDGYNIGLSYAEKYRSDLGNYLVNKYPDLDFVIIINVAKSISYRGQDKVDLSGLAEKYGGGGHKNASGSPLPPKLLENITKMIFPTIELKENLSKEEIK